MASERNAVDVSDAPELLRLAEEVHRTRRPCLLRRGDADLAVLVPAPPARRRRAAQPSAQEDLDAFLSSAGSWKDVDTDKLIADIYESRRSSRPPVEL